MIRTRWIGLRWDIGTATFSGYDEDNFANVQVDVYGGQEASAAPLEQHSLYGFTSRPLDPDADGLGAQVLYAWEGNVGHALVLDDARISPKLPMLKKGGSVQYGATGSFSLIDGENGSVMTYVPYAFDGNGDAKKAMAVSMDTETNALSIIHGDGMAVVMSEEKIVLRSKSGKSSIVLTDDGVQIFGNVQVMGAMIVGLSATPLPNLPPASVAMMISVNPPGFIPSQALLVAR